MKIIKQTAPASSIRNIQDEVEMIYHAIRSLKHRPGQPLCSKAEFKSWALNDEQFNSLWLDFEETGFDKEFEPWCVMKSPPMGGNYRSGWVPDNMVFVYKAYLTNPHQFNYTPMSQQERVDAETRYQEALKLNEELSKKQQAEYQRKIQELADRKKAAEDFVRKTDGY